jgi:hypothetical protein
MEKTIRHKFSISEIGGELLLLLFIILLIYTTVSNSKYPYFQQAIYYNTTEGTLNYTLNETSELEFFKINCRLWNYDIKKRTMRFSCYNSTIVDIKVYEFPNQSEILDMMTPKLRDNLK